MKESTSTAIGFAALFSQIAFHGGEIRISTDSGISATTKVENLQELLDNIEYMYRMLTYLKENGAL